MIKDTIELLEIDFSKYKSIAINGVILVNTTIEARKNDIGINLIGISKGEIVMSITFLYIRNVEVKEINKGFLSIDEVKQ